MFSVTVKVYLLFDFITDAIPTQDFPAFSKMFLSCFAFATIFFFTPYEVENFNVWRVAHVWLLNRLFDAALPRLIVAMNVALRRRCPDIYEIVIQQCISFLFCSICLLNAAQCLLCHSVCDNLVVINIWKARFFVIFISILFTLTCNFSR